MNYRSIFIFQSNIKNQFKCDQCGKMYSTLSILSKWSLYILFPYHYHVILHSHNSYILSTYSVTYYKPQTYLTLPSPFIHSLTFKQSYQYYTFLLYYILLTFLTSIFYSLFPHRIHYRSKPSFLPSTPHLFHSFHFQNYTNSHIKSILSPFPYMQNLNVLL